MIHILKKLSAILLLFTGLAVSNSTLGCAPEELDEYGQLSFTSQSIPPAQIVSTTTRNSHSNHNKVQNSSHEDRLVGEEIHDDCECCESCTCISCTGCPASCGTALTGKPVEMQSSSQSKDYSPEICLGYVSLTPSLLEHPPK